MLVGPLPKIISGMKLVDALDYRFGIGHWNYKLLEKRVPRKRSRMPYRYYRKYSLRVLSEICGYTEAYVQFYCSDGRLDPRKEWVLERMDSHDYQHSFGHNSEYTFLEALAKDAGVWPAPKWWRVKRRLLAATQQSYTK